MNSLTSANNVEISLTSEDVKTSTIEKGLWTTEEVASYLRVSPKTVFNLRKKGLPHYLLGGAAVRFSRQEIEHYLVNSRSLISHRRRQIAREGGSA